MNYKRIVCLLGGMACVVTLSGCLSAQYTHISPQSHLDYPNSNVTPLGPVKVKVPGPASFIKAPDIRTSESDRLVYEAALKQQPGANIVVDYSKIYRSYVFFPIGWSTLQLEGTACKMEVGKQELK